MPNLATPWGHDRRLGSLRTRGGVFCAPPLTRCDRCLA